MVTRDRNQLGLPEEMWVLTRVRLTLVTFRQPIEDPIVEWGQLLAVPACDPQPEPGALVADPPAPSAGTVIEEPDAACRRAPPARRRPGHCRAGDPHRGRGQRARLPRPQGRADTLRTPAPGSKSGRGPTSAASQVDLDAGVTFQRRVGFGHLRRRHDRLDFPGCLPPGPPLGRVPSFAAQGVALVSDAVFEAVSLDECGGVDPGATGSPSVGSGPSIRVR